MGSVTQAHTFVTGETLTAPILNANPAAFVNAFKNIDNANVGALGFYANQIIPTTSPQATFGGSVVYAFANGLSVASGIALTTSGLATTAVGIQNDGAATGGLQMNVPTGSTNGFTFSTNGSTVAKIGNGGLFTLNGGLNLPGTGTALSASNVGVQNDGGGTPGLQMNVPTGSTNGFTFTVNGSLTAFITRLGVFTTNSQVVPGNGGTAGTAAIYSGTNSPNGSVSAPNGSLFIRYDGGSGARLYVNTSGASTSGTTWTAVSGV